MHAFCLLRTSVVGDIVSRLVRNLDAHTIDEALAFVKSREAFSVSLAEYLKAAKCSFSTRGTAPFIRGGSVLYRDAEPCAVLLLTRAGLLLHNSEPNTNSAAIYRACKRLVTAQVRSIVGTEMHTCVIARSISGITTHAQQERYYLLVLPLHTPRVEYEQNSAPLHIRRAQLKDMREIFPLHMHYKREEVLPVGNSPKHKATVRTLHAHLRTRVIFHASIGGHIVAKAQTNAHGFHCHQIGGVYTVPAYRNRGIATALVATLAYNRLDIGKTPVLFVKVRNMAARRVYEKIGFTLHGLYRVINL